MSSLYGKQSGLYKAALFCAVLSAGTFAGVGTAAASGSSGSTTIIANIAPVRYILVDNRNTILEVQSNSKINIAPIVYRNSFNTKPIALTPVVYRQYAAILKHADTRKAGAIYKSADSPAGKVKSLAKQISLISHPHKF